MVASEADVAATVANLERIMTGMAKGAEKNPKLYAELLALQKYMAAIFSISKAVSKLPKPSRVKTEKEKELNRLTRIRYYYKLASLMNSIPTSMRAKDNKIKIAFDEVILSANALAKATPNSRLQYQSTFIKAVNIFTNYASRTIISNIEAIDKVLAQKANIREHKKFQIIATKIINTCSRIAQKKWAPPNYELSPMTLDTFVTASAALFVWMGIAMVIFVWILQATGIMYVPEGIVAGAAVAFIGAVQVIPMWFGGLVTLEALLNRLGYTGMYEKYGI